MFLSSFSLLRMQSTESRHAEHDMPFPRFASLSVFIGFLACAFASCSKSADSLAIPKPQSTGVASAQSPVAQPNWIWASTPAPQPDRERVWFRKQFAIDRRCDSAKLFICGDDGLNVFIDGREVLSSDSWTTPTFKDVSHFLPSKERPDGVGQHVIAIETRNDAGVGGIIIQMDIESFNGPSQKIVTDQSWLAVHGPAEGPWMQVGYDDHAWPAAKILAPLGSGPWGKKINEQTFTAIAALRVPTATPVAEMKIAKDFRVELLYTVPKDQEGSWVCMCLDTKGRMIVCDQHGGLYRLTLPPLDKTAPPTIEKIDVDIGEAQGLLWAFDSLYVNVNKATKYPHGLYRVRDTDGDDKLDRVEILRAFIGGGEHGPHAVALAPDGKSLYVVIGNQTKQTELADSRVPLHYGEDHLLPRMPDGRGFMSDVLAPGGCIYRVDPDGKRWELTANGFRNEYDAAFNRAGELFTYDADMEWDMNTPWYRPTRVNHVVSGGEYGWRNGAGKWPPYYIDSIGAVVNVGPGSPTGITFGYGTAFPAKYQDALFLCDWSYGKIYALHLTPDGASYTGQLEEFVAGSPLPLTDIVVNPHDGALYFAIGGRKTQSGLYRVTYTGAESTSATAMEVDSGSDLRVLRRKLETFHRPDPEAVAAVWNYLGHSDRAIRYAARIALEHQPVEEWTERALQEPNARAAMPALLALVRSSANDPFHRKENEPAPDATLGAAIHAALDRIDWSKLSTDERLDFVRVHAVLFNRFGAPSEADRNRTIAKYDAIYPTADRRLNAEVSNLLVFLQASTAAAKTVALLESAQTQEEQIEYARALRMLKTGWTPSLRKTYFEWLAKAVNYKGGASFGLFVQGIKKDAIATLSDDEKVAFKDVLEAKPGTPSTLIRAMPRPLVKEWKMEELLAAVEPGLTGRSFDRGRQMFATANCFACHRFDNEGGAIGPDLSSLAGRFSLRDILESILEPSKVVSDQYAAVTVVTLDGRILTGRIVNARGDSFVLNTNMLDPNALENVDRKQIDEQFPARTSMMPTGLINSLNEDEILDLLAYVVSRGDRNHAMFQQHSAADR